MKRALSVLAAATLMSPISACSGGSDYCDNVKSAAEDINFDFVTLTQEQFEELPDRIRDIEDSAPDDVKADWANIGDALAELNDILSSAGITLDELRGLLAGQVPEGLDEGAQADLTERLTPLIGNSALQESTQAIQTSASEECDVQIGA